MVDILVATPGRLMAHLKGTPGATLDHLRYLVCHESMQSFLCGWLSSSISWSAMHQFLASLRFNRRIQRLLLQVIDETDRLLRQAYQDWLPYVTAATADACRDGGDLLTGGPRRRVLKIVASATLTRDPSKIERLGLHCPLYIAVGATDHRRAGPAADPPVPSSSWHINRCFHGQLVSVSGSKKESFGSKGASRRRVLVALSGRYALPKSLKEFKVVCAGADKPLLTIALLRQLVHEPTLVFTASVESTRRYTQIAPLPIMQLTNAAMTQCT